MINEVDSDKNGLLEFEEFIRIMAKRMTWESMAFEISEAFRFVAFLLSMFMLHDLLLILTQVFADCGSKYLNIYLLSL